MAGAVAQWQQKERRGFSLSWLDRCRWNVVDLVTVIGQRALPGYLHCDIDMTRVEALRERFRARGQKITTTAILLKAIGIAQRSHPQSRSVPMPWGRIVTLNNIVAGFTVERVVDGKYAVFLGTIEAPDRKPLETIAAELRNYAEGEIADIPQLRTQERFSGLPWFVRHFILWLAMRDAPLRLRFMDATFGVSSLGKFGVRHVMGPCVSTSTFGVGALEDRPVVRSGRMEIHAMITLSLGFDLGVFDAGRAALFMREIRMLLESGLDDYVSAEPSSDSGILGWTSPPV